METDKDKFLDAITIVLDASANTLLDGFDSAAIKKWRNRLVTLPAQIKAGKIKNPEEVERYINIALKAAIIKTKSEQQKNLLMLFAKLISRLLSTFLLSQVKQSVVLSPVTPPTSPNLTENSQTI